MHEENNQKVNKTLSNVLEMRLTIQNVHEIFCKKWKVPAGSCTDEVESQEERQPNKDLVPFLKHMLR